MVSAAFAGSPIYLRTVLDGAGAVVGENLSAFAADADIWTVALRHRGSDGISSNLYGTGVAWAGKAGCTFGRSGLALQERRYCAVWYLPAPDAAMAVIGSRMRICAFGHRFFHSVLISVQCVRYGTVLGLFGIWEGCQFFLAGIPLIILILIVVMLSQNGLQQIFIPVRPHSQVRLYLSGLTKGICTAAIGLCVMQILIPVVTLTVGIGSWEQLTASAVLAGEELMISCGIGLMAALLTIFPAFAAAAILCSTGNRFLRMLFLFPLAMPGALIGVGWLELLNGSFLHGITGTLLFPALGCATRFMPFGTMILTGMLFRVDKKCLEAAEVLQSSKRKAFLAVKLPMFAPGILASGLLVFLLAIGDVGVTLMTAPPGKEPFSIKIYNYLHYGASEMVSGFCMVVVLVCLTVTVAMIELLRMRKHGN